MIKWKTQGSFLVEKRVFQHFSEAIYTRKNATKNASKGTVYHRRPSLRCDAGWIFLVVGVLIHH